MTKVFEVENIKCGGCMNSIRKGLEQIPGVRSAQAENEQGSVTVDFDENKLLPEAIAHKLADLGYPLVGENNFGKKAKSYVSCMIGRVSGE